MENLQALIFDVDGTLADTERDGHRPAFNLAFREAGMTWEWSVSLYGELLKVTGGKERIRAYVDQYHPDFSAHEELERLIAGIHRAKNRYYAEILARGAIPMRPGVVRLLQEARAQGLRLAIATTTTYENVITLLVHSIGPEAVSWFEVIAAGDVVPAKKPAPDIYRYALERLALGPGQCLAFEDSINGLKSALGTDLKTVITVNDYTRNEDFSGASLVVDHLGEPDLPFTLIGGKVPGNSYLDVAALRRLHAA